MFEGSVDIAMTTYLYVAIHQVTDMWWAAMICV